jgi:hypothetical protein
MRTLLFIALIMASAFVLKQWLASSHARGRPGAWRGRVRLGHDFDDVPEIAAAFSEDPFESARSLRGKLDIEDVSAELRRIDRHTWSPPPTIR